MFAYVRVFLFHYLSEDGVPKRPVDRLERPSLRHFRDLSLAVSSVSAARDISPCLRFQRLNMSDQVVAALYLPVQPSRADPGLVPNAVPCGAHLLRRRRLIPPRQPI